MNINLDFKERFADDIKNGRKRTTIRLRGKRRANVGDWLHQFTGLRTKQCVKLQSVRCRETVDIEIYTELLEIRAGGHWQGTVSAMRIAADDGFDNLKDFFAFFREQYGEGVHQMILYRW